MKKRVVFSILLAIALIPAVVVLAAYSSSILVQNTSGVDYPMVGGYSSANISFMAANGIFASVNGTDARVKYGATDQHFMLAEDRVAYATSISQHASKTLTFSTGNNASASNVFSIVPGYGGYVTTPYSVASEPGGNYTLSMPVWVNTNSATTIMNHPDEFTIYTDGVTGNVTASVITANMTQFQTNATYTMFGVGDTRIGENITSFPIGSIISVGFKLSKSGAPAGTVAVKIRKVSDDSVVGTLGSMNASSLTGVYTLYEFASTPVYNASVQDLRFSVEYSGGDAGNLVNVAAQTGGSVFGGGDWFRYNGAYTTNPATDTYFNILSGISLSVASPNGHAIVTLQSNSINQWLTVGSQSSANYSASSIPNTISSNWTWLQSVPYADYIIYYVGGNLRLWYQPNTIIIGATLPDRVNTTNGTIVWGTFPSGVTANMSGLVSDYDPGAGTSGDGQDIAPSINGTAHATTGDAAKTLILQSDPLWGIWNAIDTAIQGAIPGGSLPPLLQMEILTLLLALLGFVIVYAQFAHLLIAGIVFCIPFGYRVAQHTMEWWVIPILVLWLVGCAIMENRQTVG